MKSFSMASGRSTTPSPPEEPHQVVPASRNESYGAWEGSSKRTRRQPSKLKKLAQGVSSLFHSPTEPTLVHFSPCASRRT